ncbi:hypothetical protein BG262_06105 [Floricoccus penangensis]|uniref:Uncharacterized protein n=1 Tax=Floricoccus penangensis TaxID=1859475 RepID=A0A9Q5JFG0_9LACT|nr:hypothetical protein [Floricoccus penangensis]OFI46055.1 hypothetical protein BG262_06105 [Floricoccus penangensis]
MKKEILIEFIEDLLSYYDKGYLGGFIMPEDNNPKLQKNDTKNTLYFTLPMALNYQRNSFKLWEAANKTYHDPETIDVFSPEEVISMSIDDLRSKLTKYKVALQPNKQIDIWKRLCETIQEEFDGKIENMFSDNDYNILLIKEHINQNKKKYPYLSGPKIMNYWLFVLSKYTDLRFKKLENISIIPDTHIIQSSIKLGIIEDSELNKNHIRYIVAERWEQLLNGTQHIPSDLHTPLWLWSRANFIDIKNKEGITYEF